MEAVSLIGILSFCTYEDIKTKHVEVISLLTFGALGFLMHLVNNSINIFSILGGMLLGVVLFIISIVSGEHIGKGDALMIMISGIYIGFWENLILLWGASFMSGIVGVVLYVRNKRSARIPMAPFFLMMYVGMLIFKEALNVL